MNIEKAIKILKELKKNEWGELLNCWDYGAEESEAIETLLTAYEKEKEGREKLQYEATEAEEYIKELKKYIKKNKIRIPMPEEYQSSGDWGKEVTIQTKDYISKDEYEKLLNDYNKRVEEILKLEKQNKELENADLTSVWLDGVEDGKKCFKDKIKAKIEEVSDGTYDAKIVLQSLLEKE